MDPSESAGLLKGNRSSSDKEHQYGATYRVKPTKDEKVREKEPPFHAVHQKPSPGFFKLSRTRIGHLNFLGLGGFPALGALSRPFQRRERAPLPAEHRVGAPLSPPQRLP